MFSHLVRLPGFLLALLVIFGLQSVDRSFGPVLPLFVAQLGVDPSRVPITAGVLFSLGAVSAAFGSQLAPRLLEKRSAQSIIVTGTLVGAVALTVIVGAPGIWMFGAAIAVAGVAIGTSTTAIYSVAGALLPPMRTPRDSAS